MPHQYGYNNNDNMHNHNNNNTIIQQYYLALNNCYTDRNNNEYGRGGCNKNRYRTNNNKFDGDLIEIIIIVSHQMDIQ